MLKKYPRLIAVFIYLAVIFAVLTFIFNLDYAVPFEYTPIEKGVADLTEYDFETKYTYAEGEAEFYFDRLLSPEELKNEAPDSYQYKPMAKTAEYVTAKIRFLVPNGKYTISGNSPEYASRIFINGELMGVFGHIDESNTDNNVYRVAPFEYTVYTQDGVIELVTHSSGLIREDPSYYGYSIGKYELSNGFQRNNPIANIIPLGIFVTCGLFFLGYFLIIPSERSNLWFALMSLTLGLFSGVSSSKVLLEYFPVLDYEFTFFVENGGLMIVSTLFVLFTRAIFGKIIPKRFVIAACAVNAAMMAFLLYLPVRMAAKYIGVNLFVIITIIAMTTVCISIRIKRLNEEQIISFAGQICFLLGGVSDILAAQFHIQLFPHNWYDAAIGMQVFVFAQMVALILHNSRAFENERRLALENASLERTNQMKTELLSNMSHDMKTPLTVISNVSQLASMRTSDEYVKDKMNTAVTEVERMKIMVSQLLEVSKIEDGAAQWSFNRINLRSLISDTVVTYFQELDEHDNILWVEVPEVLPDVKADHTYIARVLVNLIHNATRFTHKGKITVGASFKNGTGEVKVFVEDTGAGMTPEQISHIFERYYTNGSSTGTGLGLFICKKIIDAHGGVITAQSEPGHGTRIVFTLPVYA